MKLVNRTAYRTEELRKLLSLVHEHMAKTEGRLGGWGRGWGSKKHTITIKVTYSSSPARRTGRSRSAELENLLWHRRRGRGNVA